MIRGGGLLNYILQQLSALLLVMYPWLLLGSTSTGPHPESIFSLSSTILLLLQPLLQTPPVLPLYLLVLILNKDFGSTISVCQCLSVLPSSSPSTTDLFSKKILHYSLLSYLQCALNPFWYLHLLAGTQNLSSAYLLLHVPQNPYSAYYYLLAPLANNLSYIHPPFLPAFPPILILN